MTGATAASAALSAAAQRVALAIDTSNEVIALGLGRLDVATRTVRPLATRELAAHRASNTQLIPQIDELMNEVGLVRENLAVIACGRGPGSFTGVRIAMATAKGLATGLNVGLVGLSTLDAIAWGAWLSGVRGRLLVVADAMRHEVYPAHFQLSDAGCAREEADSVIKIEALADRLPDTTNPMCGDALRKYSSELAKKGDPLPEDLWTATGAGLLAALQAAWRADAADPLDRRRHDPAVALPVYTRLSDAEENERARLAACTPRDLVSGVAGPAADQGKRANGDASGESSPEYFRNVRFAPLDRAHTAAVADLESEAMGTDAWGATQVADELGRKDRSWWMALAEDGSLAGYAGGRVVDGALEILKVACAAPSRRRGLGRELLARLAEDARNLGAEQAKLEVRAGNEGARAFYEALGFREVGRRPKYYSDGEDALLMDGPLPASVCDVAGMTLDVSEMGGSSGDSSAECGDSSASADASASSASAESPAAPASASAAPRPESATSRPEPPLLLAIETSCDETAAALVDGSGAILANVVASQIDFHARFGGVVPEIASRKHIEAICGVCDTALEAAGRSYADLEGVAVTYAPGLVGALVVGVAFAKGLAWSRGVPLVAVNHLEGHLYANKLADAQFAPPAVASLVSGGNTLLVSMEDWGRYVTLGSTIDDAVGEAFDKVAKAMGLGYPGGPAIGRLAAAGDPAAIPFPRAMMRSGDLRFSLSGLKTAVLTYMEQERAAGREPDLADVAASFQQAVIDVQVAKAKAALKQTGARTLALGGGVAANAALRAAYEQLAAELGVRLVMAPPAVCGDNAAMIALVGLDRYRAGRFAPLSLDAQAHADLDAAY